MPNPPAQAPANVRNVLDFTSGGGAQRTPDQVTTASAILPVPLAPQVLGVDAAMFTLTAANDYTQTVTFSALPSRDNSINPLNPNLASGTNVTILAKDQLIFTTNIQNLTVAPTAIPLVTVAPQGITTANTRVVGPFLGAGTYQTFQAIVKATVPGGFTGDISGFITGLLYLSIG